ncbi:MAG: VUT family protein, partial [Spirosomataceae bacterium]
MKFTRKQSLYIFLCCLFLTNAIVAEIVVAKIFSIEGTIGVAPLNLDILGYTLDLNMSAGVLNWPFVFIASDIINEYFGTKGVKRISYLTAAFIAYSFILIYIATILLPADFWLDVNKVDSKGNPINIDEGFKLI